MHAHAGPLPTETAKWLDQNSVEPLHKPVVRVVSRAKRAATSARKFSASGLSGRLGAGAIAPPGAIMAPPAASSRMAGAEAAAFASASLAALRILSASRASMRLAALSFRAAKPATLSSGLMAAGLIWAST